MGQSTTYYSKTENARGKWDTKSIMYEGSSMGHVRERRNERGAR